MLATLDAAGRDAAEIARLFWIMAAGAAVIWLTVTALVLRAMRRQRSQWTERDGLVLIGVGGFVIPAIVLAALLSVGMPSLTRQLDAAPALRFRSGQADSVRISVVGEQWWWRIRYELPGGGQVELANEIRLPLGRVADVTLASTNVIHAFWVPSLAGKVDMIPGRITRLTLEPTRSGVYRGVCAEYCGASHARMAFIVEVLAPEAFEEWLAAQAGNASAPTLAEVSAGQSAFFRNGCAACHAIRGTPAVATIGPDLTHVGSRHSLAAATLANDTAALTQWIRRPAHIKPGALMPPFEMLPANELQSIAAYLRDLK